MRKEIIKNRGLKKRIIANKTCEKCGKKVRNFWKYKGKFLCYNCYIKNFKRIGNFKGITIEKALNKIYEVKKYITKKGNESTSPIQFPKCLIGKKFKIVLVDDTTE